MERKASHYLVHAILPPDVPYCYNWVSFSEQGVEYLSSSIYYGYAKMSCLIFSLQWEFVDESINALKNWRQIWYLPWLIVDAFFSLFRDNLVTGSSQKKRARWFLFLGILWLVIGLKIIWFQIFVIISKIIFILVVVAYIIECHASF